MERVLGVLKPLEGEGLIAAWHDGKLLPGDQWHAKILAEMADADLVLLLVSDSLLASSYVNDTEIPFALERADRGRLTLVPVILESCAWTRRSFARYQALPADRVPLAERADVEAALENCREQLRRIFVPVEGFRAAKASGDAKTAGDLPLVRVVFEMPAERLPDFTALLGGARTIADDPELQTYMANRVADGKAKERRRWEWTLAGSPTGLGKLEAAASDGRLAALLAIEVVSVERSVGATFYAGTYLADQAEAPPLLDRMIATGSTGELPRLHGLAVRPSEPDWLMPLFWKVDYEIEGEAWEREKQKLLSYFYTSLALPNDVKVNLSAFERDHVMARNLAQTPLGQLLAEQDCMLKQLTATMLHPASEPGRSYWARIEELANKAGQHGPLELWQKAWIVLDAATAQQKSAGEVFPHPLPPGFEIRIDDWSGWIPECKVKVMCETDYLALGKRAEELRQTEDVDRDFHDEAMAIFRELIAPRLTEEVNTNVHFAPLRQATYCVALGKWYREQIAEQGIHTRLMEVAAQVREQLGDATEIGPGPDAPPWMNDCFNRYLQLLEGVFRVTLPDAQGQSDGRKVRVYQSGCVRL